MQADDPRPSPRLRELDRVRSHIPCLEPALRIDVRRLVAQVARERLVLRLRRALKVDLLEIGDDLGELHEVVVDDLGARVGMGPRRTLDLGLPELDRREKGEERALEVVDPEAARSRDDVPPGRLTRWPSRA